MTKIISIHSFRGGTGKSNSTANLVSLFAQEGLRVGVVDTDIASPGIHVLFGLAEEDMGYALNDYLWGKCKIKQCAHDVTKKLGADVKGQVFLIPSSVKAGNIAKILREGYDVNLLNDGFQDLIEELKLDILAIDTHPGLSEETLLSIAISDVLILILRPDQQDYQGTSVTVEVARKLGIQKMFLVVNKLPQQFNADEVKAKVEKAYQAEVVAVLPHSDEMMMLASSGIFCFKYPDHPITALYRQIARKILNS